MLFRSVRFIHLPADRMITEEQPVQLRVRQPRGIVEPPGDSLQLPCTPGFDLSPVERGVGEHVAPQGKPGLHVLGQRIQGRRDAASCATERELMRVVRDLLVDVGRGSGGGAAVAQQGRQSHGSGIVVSREESVPTPEIGENGHQRQRPVLEVEDVDTLHFEVARLQIGRAHV